MSIILTSSKSNEITFRQKGEPLLVQEIFLPSHLLNLSGELVTLEKEDGKKTCINTDHRDLINCQPNNEISSATVSVCDIAPTGTGTGQNQSVSTNTFSDCFVLVVGLCIITFIVLHVFHLVRPLL